MPRQVGVPCQLAEDTIGIREQQHLVAGQFLQKLRVLHFVALTVRKKTT